MGLGFGEIDQAGVVVDHSAADFPLDPVADRDVALAVAMLRHQDRVQVSEDGRYHICLRPTNIPSDTHHGVWCFFAPPST